MKTGKPTSTDDPGGDGLDKLLSTWRVEDGLPTGFRAGVWRRIHEREHSVAWVESLRTYWIAVADWLARPAMATGYLAVLLVVGALAGWAQAERDQVQQKVVLSARYLQSVNPYQVEIRELP